MVRRPHIMWQVVTAVCSTAPAIAAQQPGRMQSPVSVVVRPVERLTVITPTLRPLAGTDTVVAGAGAWSIATNALNRQLWVWLEGDPAPGVTVTVEFEAPAEARSRGPVQLRRAARVAVDGISTTRSGTLRLTVRAVGRAGSLQGAPIPAIRYALSDGNGSSGSPAGSIAALTSADGSGAGGS